MKRIVGIILATILIMTAGLNYAFAEPVEYSERCLKIKQAERAIQEKYQIVPDMYSFFVRDIAESDNGTITVTLRGQDIYYWVLGTYIGSSDGKNTTSWSNEGKQTYGGFDAPAWDALQLHQMVDLARKERDTGSFFHQAVTIAQRDDPEYTELRPEDPMLIYEHGFEISVPHPDHETIEAKSNYSKDQLNDIAIAAITETYELKTDVAEKICEVDSEPDFRYEIKDGQLIYHAWMGLQQSDEDYSDITVPKNEHDGQYLVIINAETGVVEDVVYDAFLLGAG